MKLEHKKGEGIVNIKKLNYISRILLVVMISIVIITAGLLFIMRSFSSSKNSIQRSTEVFKASLLLEEKMWEFEEKDEIEEGVNDGDFVENEKYAWRISANPIEDSELNLVILEVFQKKDPQNTKYSILTYLKNKTE